MSDPKHLVFIESSGQLIGVPADAVSRSLESESGTSENHSENTENGKKEKGSSSSRGEDAPKEAGQSSSTSRSARAVASDPQGSGKNATGASTQEMPSTEEPEVQPSRAAPSRGSGGSGGSGGASTSSDFCFDGIPGLDGPSSDSPEAQLENQKRGPLKAVTVGGPLFSTLARCPRLRLEGYRGVTRRVTPSHNCYRL